MTPGYTRMKCMNTCINIISNSIKIFSNEGKKILTEQFECVLKMYHMKEICSTPSVGSHSSGNVSNGPLPFSVLFSTCLTLFFSLNSFWFLLGNNRADLLARQHPCPSWKHETANNLMFRCGSAFTSHVTYFKIYRCKCNSKGESSALVSTLTLSPPEVPDLAFTPVSHLLLKAMGTSSHLPHYGVNVYTDRHSQPRLRDYSQGKYSPYKTHTRNSATPWGLNSKS